MAIKSDFRHPSSDISHQPSDLSGHINKMLLYFSNFDYVPTIDEIYEFYPKKVSKSTVGEYLKKNQKLKIKSQNFQKEREKRKRISEHKVNLISTYIKLLSRFPQIKLVGLSGTVAMNNAKVNDDIDLFIITAENRLWTGRLVALMLSQLFNLRRKRSGNIVIASDQAPNGAWERGNLVTNKTVYNNGIASSSDVRRLPRNDIRVKNKVCLNLFFDESNLQVPKYKQTEYVAHEVLQMKPLISKDQVYERFLKANEWVFGFFPNAEKTSAKFKVQNSKLQFKIQNYPKNFKLLTLIFNFSLLIFNLLAEGIETLIKNLQLMLINRHKTSEIITDTQLWFFPDDYELKIHELTRIKKI